MCFSFDTAAPSTKNAVGFPEQMREVIADPDDDLGRVFDCQRLDIVGELAEALRDPKTAGL